MNLQQKMCPRCGGGGERYATSRGGLDSMCKECRKLRSAELRRLHPGRQAAQNRAWRIRQHGITVDEYEAMGDTCAICGGTGKEGKRLNIDHDHAHCSGPTGCRQCVRGVLCDRCNLFVGFLEDPNIDLAKTLHYLARRSP